MSERDVDERPLSEVQYKLDHLLEYLADKSGWLGMMGIGWPEDDGLYEEPVESDEPSGRVIQLVPPVGYEKLPFVEG